MIPKHEENERKCSERLRVMRKRNRKSQDCIAGLIGTDRATVIHWERGKYLPPAGALIELANLYGCTVDYILGRTDIPG